MNYAIEPTGRSDEWQWQARRLSDGVVVGFYATLTRATSFADNARMNESTSVANLDPPPQVIA